ncbi:MAG: hypothetical protein A2020_04665 [Lentisphaerae bacterium GWF2_45_14]|nr:MAG: hypothetical protein A2020_04665 [Lentisphaerae bacterium GWF2_45_14]
MKKKITHVLLGIALTAFVLRLAIGIDLFVNDPFSGNPPATTDMATYINSALSIINLNYSEVFYYQPFYYAVFMPLTLLLFCGSIIGTVVTQAVLGAATVYLAGISCARIFGKKAAVITALLLAFNNVLTAYTAYCLIEILQAFWITLILYLSVEVIRKSSPKRWIIIGIITGLSILTRGNIWFFVPGLAALALYCGCRNGRKSFLPLTLLIAFIIIPQLPFAAWNTVKLGKLSGPSTAGSAVLALGNTPEAPPAGKDPGSFGPGPMEYPLSFHVWMADLEKKSVPSRIFKWFKEEPLAYTELTFRKILLFWDWREVPNNIELKYNCSKSTIFSRLPLIPNYFAIFPGLAGFIAFLLYAIKRRNPKLLILLYFIAAYTMATALFYILGRFRLPCIPLMGITAGGFFYFFFKAFVKKKRMMFYSFFVAFCFAGFISFASYDLYRGGLEKNIIRLVRPDGIRIDVLPNRFVYLDNGPVTCGGWIPQELKSGDTLRKKFMIREKGPFIKSVMTIRLFWESEGFAELETNGMPFTIKSGTAGLKEHEIPVVINNDGFVRLTLNKIGSAKVFYITDLQRDYGRTFINDEKSPGELVSFLEISK